MPREWVISRDRVTDLREVELKPARIPSAPQSNQTELERKVVVENFAVVFQIAHRKNVPAEVGQDGDFEQAIVKDDGSELSLG